MRRGLWGCPAPLRQDAALCALQATSLDEFSVVTGNDDPDRDPVEWKVSGKVYRVTWSTGAFLQYLAGRYYSLAGEDAV